MSILNVDSTAKLPRPIRKEVLLSEQLNYMLEQYSKKLKRQKRTYNSQSDIVTIALANYFNSIN